MQVLHRSWFALFPRVGFVSLLGGVLFFLAPINRAQTPPPRTPPALGTIKSISAETLTLTTDSGAEVKIQLPADIKAVRVPPGAKDLKEAAPIQLSDLQPGDRILVRMKPGADASSLVASSIVAMSKSDIAAKQQKEREEWQRHGIGGLVSSVDSAQDAVTIKTLGAAGPRDIVVHIAKTTILRRYAPGSINFDEAKVAPLSDIKAGDQLRARGTRSSEGNEFAADEVVSGSFRNIAGLVVSVDASSGTLTVNDLATKKHVDLKVTPESQMRKLPERMAQAIAMRLKGATPPGNGNASSAPGQPSGTPPAKPNASEGAASNSGSGAAGGPPRGGGGDMQQMLSRLPANQLGDFQKGDAVMIVATSGEGDGASTVVTLLSGVEPILQANSGQAASILSPWNFSQGGGDAGTN